jgi:hypothetical protein
MKNLPYLDMPKILVDGKEDPSVVTNKQYAKGTLTFDVTHFSTFMTAPVVSISQPKPGFEVRKDKLVLEGSINDITATISAKLNRGSRQEWGDGGRQRFRYSPQGNQIWNNIFIRSSYNSWSHGGWGWCLFVLQNEEI